MSVIIRLQNLPWSANSYDIRQFFQGLAIPEGGVHIVGGELGDAFIAFRYLPFSLSSIGKLSLFSYLPIHYLIRPTLLPYRYHQLYDKTFTFAGLIPWLA